VLGRDLLAEGISVSTIGLGLGYNEDLMLRLARASDGNHAFASDAAALVPIFDREFNDVLGSCAQMVSIDVDMQPGVRVVRALSRDGTVDGQKATFRMNQVYQATEHYVLLEVEVDKTVADGEKDLGRVRVAYTASQDGAQHKLDASVRATFSPSAEAVAASRDLQVLEAAVEQSARERTNAAVTLRDQGKTAEAQALFDQSLKEIKSFAASLPTPSPRMQQLVSDYEAVSTFAPATRPAAWNEQRKLLRQFDAGHAGSNVRY